jgi:hypothetical protein
LVLAHRNHVGEVPSYSLKRSANGRPHKNNLLRLVTETQSFLLPLEPYLEAFVERDPRLRLELLAKGLAPEAEI